MAEVPVNKESRAVGQTQQPTSIWRGMPSLFPFSTRELLSLSPFELMRRMTDEMDRVFAGWGMPSRTEPTLWSPPIEVVEKNGSIVVSADLPGMRKEDVKVELTPQGLYIRGERKRQHKEEQEGLYRSEICYGSFTRMIPLPEDVESEKATAKFDNGVLTVTVPVPQQQQRRRQIPIEGEGGAKQQAGGSRTAA